MPTLLKDIPVGRMTPEEVAALSNKTFDYADRERVSMREAERKIKEEVHNDFIRARLLKAGEYQKAWEIPSYEPPYYLEEGFGDFTFKEKTFEIAKAVHRGLGAVIKVPGVALKTIGEAALTRAEIAKLRRSPYAIQRFRARTMVSPAGKGARGIANMLRKAGNKYIEVVNNMMTDESRESQTARQQAFMSAPFYRTLTAAGESAPSYGIAIATTLTTGNPNLGLLVLGTTTSSSSYDNLRSQGVEPDLALIGATLEGSIEMVTEKIPMDMLMKGAGRPFLIRALRIGTAESFQELFAQLGQNYVEAVVKEVDPENYSTVLVAAKQEWSIIHQGWEDAMAAGFLMGSAAGTFVGGIPPTDFGFRTADQMRADYGFVPRNVNELISLTDQIKQRVREVEKPPEAPPEAVTPTEPAPTAPEFVKSSWPKFAGFVKDIRVVPQSVIDKSAARKGSTAYYDGVENVIYVSSEQSAADQVEVITHELMHAWQLKRKGVEWYNEPRPKDITFEEYQKLPQEKKAFRAGDVARQKFLEAEPEAPAVPVVAEVPAEDIKVPPKAAEVVAEGKRVIEGFKKLDTSTKETLLKQFHRIELEEGLVGNEAENLLERYRQLKSSFTKQEAQEFKAITGIIDKRIAHDEALARPVVEAKPEAVTEEPVPVIPPIEEIGKGEEKPRGTSVSVMAQAIEDEIVEENKSLYDEIPTYRAMNMREQAEKALALIESDLEKAKRIAFYQEPAPPDLFPENVFSALRTYAKMNLDIDLIMDLALNEDVVREHTIMGKRIKSLDTDQDYADPIRAIREVVEARTEQKVRKGEDISALEVKLRELQAELDRVTKARTTFTKRAERTYGVQNKLVSRTEYDTIMVRRKKEAAELGFAGRAGGVAYVPNAQDFADIAKIATFHLEAMGRDFAKWSYQMTRDFGDWITPHLKDEYDKAIKEAKKAGVEIKEAKRLITKKKRLVTVTGKIEAKLEELDLAKVPRIPIELDEEGRRLQEAYDLAREKYKAAQAVANIITEKEVQIIAQLAKDASERRAVMEKSERRKEGKGATPTELEYGVAISMFLEYVNDLKAEANKRTMWEVTKNYLTNPVDFISDFAGSLKAAKASLDNSFHLRQGLPTFLKAITGHIPSAKIWWKTFAKSWKMMWDTLRKRKVMRGLFAEMVSDPDYELLKKSKVALNVIEEEIPVDIPSRIPILGMLFRMGENAFVGSSRYMRYQLAKQYLNVWRKSGIALTQRELESLGRLANSQTGRGDIASKAKRPGLLNNLFWSPRNLRAYVDILTLHLFDRNFSPFARKQAAINLLRYVSGAAMILALAKWIDDDSVTWDSNSADFGKIRVGDTRFSIGGGAAVLIVLASRLVTRKFTSSVTGKTTSLDTRRFGTVTGKDLVFNFLDNKLSPASQLAISLIDQKTWDGEKLTIPQMVDDALTPLIIQNVFETGTSEDSANVLAALMAETMGVNVQTYSGKKKQKTNKRTKM